jgi:hypothetical protein
MGRGALPLPPRLEGANPAGDQQPHDNESPIKYTTRRTGASPLPHRLWHQQLANLHGRLIRTPGLPKQCPQQGGNTNGAATAKSMDLGLHPGAWNRGGAAGPRQCLKVGEGRPEGIPAIVAGDRPRVSPGPDLYHQHHAFTSTGGNTSTKI